MMVSGKWMNLICVLAMVVCVAASILLPAGSAEKGVSMGYEDTLFDPTRVHTIDISMENWDAFIKNCQDEEYAACDVTVDGEKFGNVAIRAKGNTSLSNVSQMDSDRYSFKIEFDHYDSAVSYHGLDKLSLNNLIQDNTFMKDYLTYRMMNEFSVPSPLASFVYITVNGEDWGLYLAAEGVEDAFLLRNWGKNHGKLYKPDSMDMGGGRGNGKEFDMNEIEFPEEPGVSVPQGAVRGGFDRGADAGGFGAKGSEDVKLVYSDDDFESYSNIFENAKTDVTDADKQRLIDAIRRMNEGDSEALDIESVIRYFVVHNFVVNDDSYTGTMIHNYYLYEENGVLSMIPWDYNLAFGTFQGGNASSSVNRDIMNPVTGGMEDRPMIAWIFENEAYTEKYCAYFAEFLKNVDALKIIEDAENLIAPYVEKDPTKFCTFEEFKTGVSALETFVKLRSESALNQLNGSGAAVNTAGFNTSDMGTMGMDGKGGFNVSPGNAGETETGDFIMPFGGMTPPGEFSAPIWPSVSSESTQAPASDPQTNAAQSAGESNEFRRNRTDQTQRNTGETRSNRLDSQNMPAENAGAQSNSSPVTLLIASIIVLLLSIAAALLIKH